MANNISAERLNLTTEETRSGLVAMWDVIGRRGHYVVYFGARGFGGYQLERSESAGESTLKTWEVQKIVDHFRLDPNGQ